MNARMRLLLRSAGRILSRIFCCVSAFATLLCTETSYDRAGAIASPFPLGFFSFPALFFFFFFGPIDFFQRALGRFLLEVDLDDLVNFDASLANRVQEKPATYLPILEQVATETAEEEFSAPIAGAKDALQRQQQPNLRHVQVLLRSSGNVIPLRQLSSAHVGRLVMVPGIVISASRVQAKATHLLLRCQRCNHEVEVSCNAGFGGATLPPQCFAKMRQLGGTPNPLDCPAFPYQIVAHKSRYVDHQVLKLQEPPEAVPTGEMPRNVQLTVDRYLVDKAQPGTRVIVIGVYGLGFRV